MSIVLVFGGTGFLGSALVKFLLLKKIKVIVYSHKKLNSLSKLHSSNLEIINTIDIEKLKTYNIDAIYHLASNLSNNSYFDFYKSNVELTLEIIEYAKKISVEQFIYISTGSVFSTSEINGFSEKTSPNPLNYYGLTKYIAERLLEIEFKNTSIQVNVVRFPSIFGKHDKIGIVNTFYKEINKNKNIELFGNGLKYRNLIYLDDAVQILYGILLKKDFLNSFEIFMAGSSDSMRIIDIVKFMIENLDSTSKIIPINKCLPSDFDVFIDISKIEKKLSIKPISISDGLKLYMKEMNYEKI